MRPAKAPLYRASIALLIAALATGGCNDEGTAVYHPNRAVAYGKVSVDGNPLVKAIVRVRGGDSDCPGDGGGSGPTDSSGNYRIILSRLTGPGTSCVMATVELPNGDSLQASGSVRFGESLPYDSIRLDLITSN